MRRNRARIVALLGGTFILGALGFAALVAAASPAVAAAEPPGCGADALAGVTFSVDGEAPLDDLSLAGPIASGTAVTMTFDGVAPGCEDHLVTLAAHRVDGSPTAEVTGAEACVLSECGGSISFEIPARAVVCRGELVAAVGPPQLDRFFYGAGELGAALIDGGACAPPAPAASVVVLCGLDARVGVSLSNSGEVDAVVTVRVGEVERVFEVGSTERLAAFEVDEDTAVTVKVLDGDKVMIERSLRPDCFDPPAPPLIRPDCAVGGASVVLDNPTPTPLAYVVTVDGVPNDVTVGPFSIERFMVPIAEQASSEIVVHDGATAELARASVPRDCERPRAEVRVECSTGTVAFVLSNDGSLRSMVDLLIDGRVMVAIPVEGGGRTVARLELAEDQRALVSARSAGVELVSRQLTLDCRAQGRPPGPPAPAPPAPPAVTPTPTPAANVPPARVLGTAFAKGGATVGQPRGTMPVTGSDPFGLLLLAVVLIASGGGFRAASDRTRHSPNRLRPAGGRATCFGSVTRRR